MKKPTHRILDRLRLTEEAPLRVRAQPPGLPLMPRPTAVLTAAHDFLVPNPRPDLVIDPHTLRMIDHE